MTAVAVAGAFDDCQRLARAAFADRELRRQRPLASANSINIGRLLPQVFYYFHAWAQLPSAPLVDADPPLVFSTPSGNFGNLTAGLMARRIGLPVSRFVAATNVNDVVPAYLQSGEYLPRASAATISNAMDVGDPSNFARIRHLYSGGGDPLNSLRRDLAGRSFDDEATRRAMREVHENRGYLLDPHTAVGYLGLKEELEAQGGGTGVVLATAHPAKFADVIRDAVGIEPPLPPALERCADLPERIVEISVDEKALRRFWWRRKLARQNYRRPALRAGCGQDARVPRPDRSAAQAPSRVWTSPARSSERVSGARPQSAGVTSWPSISSPGGT